MKSTMRSNVKFVSRLVAVVTCLLTAMSCATFDQAMCIGCTERYEGAATTLTVRERVLTRETDWRISEGPPMTPFGDSKVTKLVAIDNPYDSNVHIYVDCGSSMWEFVIKAYRTQLLIVNTTERHAYKDSCQVREDWFFTKERPTYGPGSH